MNKDIFTLTSTLVSSRTLCLQCLTSMFRACSATDSTPDRVEVLPSIGHLTTSHAKQQPPIECYMPSAFGRCDRCRFRLFIAYAWVTRGKTVTVTACIGNAPSNKNVFSLRLNYGCEFGNFRKFIQIFPEIFGNLLKNFFSFYSFNYNHIK